jgi:hypothetical protein
MGSTHYILEWYATTNLQIGLEICAFNQPKKKVLIIVGY